MFADDEKQSSGKQPCKVELSACQLVNSMIGDAQGDEHCRDRRVRSPIAACEIEIKDHCADCQAIAPRLVMNDDAGRGGSGAHVAHTFRAQGMALQSREEIRTMTLRRNDNPDTARSAVGNVRALSRVHVVSSSEESCCCYLSASYDGLMTIRRYPEISLDQKVGAEKQEAADDGADNCAVDPDVLQVAAYDCFQPV